MIEKIINFKRKYRLNSYLVMYSDDDLGFFRQIIDYL